MAHELQLIKQSSGILIPATPETSDILQSKIKLGSVLVAEFRQVRNPAFHRRFFALLNLGFEYWEPTGGAISSATAWAISSSICGFMAFMCESPFPVCTPGPRPLSSTGAPRG